jgi:hypothetical protein
MKVVTVRDFRDRASEMFRSEDVILVTRDGAPAGFYLPWDTPELPVEVRREVFLRLSEQIGAQLTEQGTEQEVLDDFAAAAVVADANVVLSALIGGRARLVIASAHPPRCVAAEAVAVEIARHIPRLANQRRLDPALLFAALQVMPIEWRPAAD